MEEIWRNSGIAIAAGIIYLIEKGAVYIQRRNRAKKAADIAAKSGMENFNLIDRQIKHVERGMLLRYFPIRVFVMHFHNGTFTDAGLSLQRLTIKHEVKSSYKIMGIEGTHQEIAIPEYMYVLISRVRMYGYYVLNSRAELPDEQIAFKEWLEYYGVDGLYATELKDKKTGKIVAILFLQFDHPCNIIKTEQTDINEQKKRIEAIYDKL